MTSRCYCAFCKSPRMIYQKRHISAFDVLLALVASGMLGFVFWQGFDPRMFVFFAIGLGLSELFISMRWRLSISCAKCGFDPVLYKQKPALAAERVRAHYKRKLEDPLGVFAPPPKLPVQRVKRQARTHEATR